MLDFRESCLSDDHTNPAEPDWCSHCPLPALVCVQCLAAEETFFTGHRSSQMSQMSPRFIVMFALWSFQLRYTAPGKMLGKDWSCHSFSWFDESMISMPCSFLLNLRVLAITIVLGSIVGLYCLYRAGSLAVVFRMQKVVVSERAFRVWGPTFMPSTFRPISVSWVRTESTISCVAMSQQAFLFHHFHLVDRCTKKTSSRKICSVVALHRYYSSRGLWYWYANGQLESQGLDKSGVPCGSILWQTTQATTTRTTCEAFMMCSRWMHSWRWIQRPCVVKSWWMLEEYNSWLVQTSTSIWPMALRTRIPIALPQHVCKKWKCRPLCVLFVFTYSCVWIRGTCFLIFPIQPGIPGLLIDWWLTLVLFWCVLGLKLHTLPKSHGTFEALQWISEFMSCGELAICTIWAESNKWREKGGFVVCNPNRSFGFSMRLLLTH